VTAWQWLKLEWYWAVPALLLGAVVLGVCIRLLRNRGRVADFVDEPGTTEEEITHEEIEKESTSAAVLDVPGVQTNGSDPVEEGPRWNAFDRSVFTTVRGFGCPPLNVSSALPERTDYSDVDLKASANWNGTECAMPTVESQSADDLEPGDEQRVTQVARNERIRAEIEALHKARVEQRERIEASTVGRAGDRPRGEPVRLKESKHLSNVVSAFLPNATQGQSGSRLESATKPESTRNQADTAEDFRFITNLFDDASPEVRNVAARALYHLQSDRAASFTRALREASPERRSRIGAALATSGLATEALTNLSGENLDKAYDAFSVLFLMAKAGEVQSLIKAIEDGPNLEVRLAVVKLLALSGQAEVVSSFRRLAVRSSLPPEVRSAVMEAIHQHRSQ
jgi:hypothetical protein